MNANAMIAWAEMKKSAADGNVRVLGGMEYRHNPQTAIRTESIEVHDGDDALKIHRQGKSWTKPYRVSWR